MKKLLNTLFVCAAGLSLSACANGLGDFDSAPPYATERTATHEQSAAPAPAPAPAPMKEKMCKPCDHSSHDSRISALEAELQACREASNRVRGAYQSELKK